jgi:Chain length determinant protein
MEANHPNSETRQRMEYTNGADGYGTNLGEGNPAAIDLLKLGLQLWRRRWLICGATLAVALAAGLTAKFLMTRTWQAQAVITPVSSTENSEDQMGGSLLDSFSGGGGGIAALFGLAGQSDNAIVALRYIAIMRSYTFTMSLLDKYHLYHRIADTVGPEGVSSWKIYRTIDEKFRCDYDYKTGNMAIYFVDADPGVAREVLSDYLDNLRNKLRNEQVQSAARAAKSLQEEIQKTSDSLLQNQLYELMARQIQREKLAQVQADFAFRVIEPPLVPDRYYAPIARNYFIISGALTFVLLSAWILIREWWSRALAHLAAQTAYEQPRPSESSSPRPTSLGLRS